jgi:hypothetical protein
MQSKKDFKVISFLDVMFDISKRLLHYKRRDVQERLLQSSKDREVGIRYGDRGYGKRPDVLLYENDILDSVKKGATSFHISEERWHNPLDLSTEMSKADQEELRKGWDLVLDIDCPYWTYSKLTTYMFVKSLRQHGINSVSCKFSGNKGFHIGVPFEAFPAAINNISIKTWFPEGPKKIALYLLDYISKTLIKVDSGGVIDFDGVHKITIEKLAEETGKEKSDLIKHICSDCKKKINPGDMKPKIESICPRCETRVFQSDSVACPKCGSIMDRITHHPKVCSCGTKNPPIEAFDPMAIVDVDTILISSRHMFRAPYSMHEKSGLVSVPIPLDTILDFDKSSAMPENVMPEKEPIFLDTRKVRKDEAMNLMTAAFDIGKEDLRFKTIIDKENEERKSQKKYDAVSKAIPVEYFPPCILKILEGLEDGKKRSLFVLMNFLTSAGWAHKEAEELLQEWNKKNRPPLKDRDITFQVNYHGQKKKLVLPPNCRSYYQDFRVCFPDAICQRIKNPVQYAKIRAADYLKENRKRPNLTDEQKEMRRLYRERLKSQKAKQKSNEAQAKRS